jgi:isocitrate dehydrogenase
VGKQSAGDQGGDVAKEMEKLLQAAQPPEFKGHIDVAWAEWLTDHKSFDAANERLCEAAEILGDRSLDVKEGRYLLKKARAAKEDH